MTRRSSVRTCRRQSAPLRAVKVGARVDRMNPNGGSLAIGHPFAATGARILSQAVKEPAAMPPGSRAVVT